MKEKKDWQGCLNLPATIVEFIHGIPAIKVFNRSLGAFKRYQHDIDAFVDSVDRTAKANAVPMGLYYVFFGAQMLFLLPASILLLQKEGDFLSGVLTVIFFFSDWAGVKGATGKYDESCGRHEPDSGKCQLLLRWGA